MCDLESFHESYSSGILLDRISTLQLLGKWEVNERLCTREVGVDPELCVHAHGHDVDPIMEASCNNNYFLVIISFGIYELILCNHGSDHIFYLIPFLGQVKPLVLYRSIHPSNLYLDLPSSTNPLVSRGYQPIALHLMHFWWSSAFPRHSHSTGSGLSSTENTG